MLLASRLLLAVADIPVATSPPLLVLPPAVEPNCCLAHVADGILPSLPLSISAVCGFATVGFLAVADISLVFV
jgi:hypothetical protein